MGLQNSTTTKATFFERAAAKLQGGNGFDRRKFAGEFCYASSHIVSTTMKLLFIVESLTNDFHETLILSNMYIIHTIRMGPGRS